MNEPKSWVADDFTTKRTKDTKVNINTRTLLSRR